MLAVADTALDLLVLELVLHGLGVGVLGLVLCILAPVDRRLEDDVLAHRCRVGRGTGGILGALSEFGPRLAVGHSRVHDLAVGDKADPPRRLDLLPVVVVSVLDDGCAAVLVGDLLGRRQIGRRGLVLLIVRPIVPVREELSSVSAALAPHTNIAAHLGTRRIPAHRDLLGLGRHFHRLSESIKVCAVSNRYVRVDGVMLRC